LIIVVTDHSIFGVFVSCQPVMLISPLLAEKILEMPIGRCINEKLFVFTE